jgi:PIN domain nuclease of toxin-antitoxin system
VIRAADTAVLVSSASGWEIGIKHRLGRLPEATEVVHNLPSLLRRSRMQVLPIALEHALAAGLLPGPHRDPFDRMLIAQARLERLPIVTSDQVFARYGVNVVW